MKNSRNKAEERKLKQILINLVGYVCELKGCGYRFNLQMHHVDCNKLNNVITNVILICPNCHTWLHSIKENEAKIVTIVVMKKRAN